MNTQRKIAPGQNSKKGSSAVGAAEAGDPILRLAQQAMAKVASASRAAPCRQQANRLALAPDVTDLAQALADTNTTRANTMIKDLLKAGVGVQDLCLDHLAPAARELGAWWEKDVLPFADVTMAAARIQSILRTIPQSRSPRAHPGDNRALFAAVPGETHTLGVVMAADFFRRLGWDVGLLIGMDHAELIDAISQDRRAVVGLSCAGRHCVSSLARVVEDIRRNRPDMGIVLSGQIVNDGDTIARLPAVDGVVDDMDRAEAVMTSVRRVTQVWSRQSIPA